MQQVRKWFTTMNRGWSKLTTVSFGTTQWLGQSLGSLEVKNSNETAATTLNRKHQD